MKSMIPLIKEGAQVRFKRASQTETVQLSYKSAYKSAMGEELSVLTTLDRLKEIRAVRGTGSTVNEIKEYLCLTQLQLSQALDMHRMIVKNTEERAKSALQPLINFQEDGILCERLPF